MPDQIFHDPSGRRNRRAGLIGGLLVALAALLVAAFFATLALAPRLPGLQMGDPRVLKALHAETAHRLAGRPAWKRVPRPAQASSDPGRRPLSVGFYVSWDEGSRASLIQHVNALDVVAPQWVALSGNAGQVKVTYDPQAEAVIASATRRPAILPLVHNSKDSEWDRAAADGVILDPTARQVLIHHLLNLAETRGYGGYVFDLENLSPRATAAYPGFIAEARAALKAIGRELWVTAPFADETWPLARLQAVSDVLVLMAYDEHEETSDPGPAASQVWYEQTLARRMAQLDPARTVLALAAYGYDWTLPYKGRPLSAEAVTFHEATQIAQDSSAKIVLDQASLNPTFGYQDEFGADHAVWFQDAVTLHNQIKATDTFRPLGYALWRLGSEDPAVWQLLPHAFGTLKTEGLQTIAPGQDVNFDGTGEVLRVSATPRGGRRTLAFDKTTGLISGETYDVLPSSYVIQRFGAHPGWVALTFDDGPDPQWTAKILDVLKAKQAPATFFVIGQNMERLPGLVQREVREGHMVGSHTWTHPNIGQVPPEEVRIELNATQRLFETLTGKSMRLFRPPFFGDAEPSTPQEVAPLLVAQDLGYLTVGLRIDPDDWKKPDPAFIVSKTLERLADTGETAGQIVLLHDSGGDRSRTVAALGPLIDRLRAKGYRLVTVDQLAGMSRADALPPTNRNKADLAVDQIAFGSLHAAEVGLKWLFIATIVLGVLRLLVLGTLALVHRLKIDGRTPALTHEGPLVSVLIPCFNEDKVIVASVARILASNWKKLEVLVLDDGSSDQTSAVVQAAYGATPGVTLMTFENGGKARALNRGLAVARGEIIVALDADTLFPPDTIGELARWFDDPTVGAVAGNAIVGNRHNLITTWQALEYVTAQNLERRALAALGAVTVVPGAVGAWRRSALEALGGYPSETLAEDQDLTLAVQRAGWRVEFDPEARAYTEAPDTVGGLLKQRFRWSFGTLQCLWKHRGGLFDRKHPILGFVALPQIWLFQILMTAVAPLVDLALVWGAASALYSHINHPLQWSPDNLSRTLFYWAAFIFLDLSFGALGMALERQAPWRDLVWLPAQRFGYRQLMYYVVIKSIDAAIRGARVGWGKLDRRATATLGPSR